MLWIQMACLIVSKESEFFEIESLKDVDYEKWEGIVQSCRAWYDAKNWDKAFCCQTTGFEGSTTFPMVVNSKKTSSADDVEIDGDKITPYAEAFKEASRLGGVAVVLSAIVFMN